MKLVRCDRCGKTLEMIDVKTAKMHAWAVSDTTPYSSNIVKYNFDLCEECRDQVLSYIQRPIIDEFTPIGCKSNIDEIKETLRKSCKCNCNEGE